MLDCNYRYCDFLLVDSFFNVVYCVIAFKQAQTVYANYLFFCVITLLHLLNAIVYFNFETDNRIW